jgi:hypothetical protein
MPLGRDDEAEAVHCNEVIILLQVSSYGKSHTARVLPAPEERGADMTYCRNFCRAAKLSNRAEESLQEIAMCNCPVFLSSS